MVETPNARALSWAARALIDGLPPEDLDGHALGGMMLRAGMDMGQRRGEARGAADAAAPPAGEDEAGAARICSLAAVTFLGLVSAILWVYPMVNTSAPGTGSDRDDALNLAAGALLHGRFPYYERTYLGNLITPMPGAVLLSAPFVLLGSSAWQNLIWLPALYLAARRLLADPRLALVLWGSVLALSPVVLQELVSGGAAA